MSVIVSLLCFVIVSYGGSAHGRVTLYGQSFHQSPATAVPGQALLLAGHGFEKGCLVIYHALASDESAAMPPETVPDISDRSSGVAQIVSDEGMPHSITVRWPDVAASDVPYMIWVRDASGKWSNGIIVNDVRPLWFTPAFAYETSTIGALPRYLKVVGRNLGPVQGSRTLVKLVSGMGQEEFLLEAEYSNGAISAIESHVAKVALPPVLVPGDYRILVSRGGGDWIPIEGRKFEVVADPDEQREVNVSVFGCFPDDGQDDTKCIRKAIQHASRNQPDRATVLLSQGVWNIGLTEQLGIMIPSGVSLKGMGSHLTTLVKSARPQTGNTARSEPWFVLEGGNEVRGITFKDERVYQSAANHGAVLQLGIKARNVPASQKVSGVVIENNKFDKPYRAISDAGISIERLFIVSNEFGAYENAIFLDGAPPDIAFPFHIDDTVITNNMFKPGSFLDLSNRRGSIATQIGASRRMDFSGNSAEGHSTDYLYDQDDDPSGWRAAFFWHLRNNHEMLLVSGNTATCTGDKTGDGEFLAFDNNHNSFAFESARSVIVATQDTVSVSSPLQIAHKGRALPPGYFREHWLQVADGAGVGQVRRVVSYDVAEGRIRFNVDPPWDVLPDSSSRIAVGLEFWQVLVLGNRIDHREPLCRKSNRRKSVNVPYGAGGIVLWAQFADSVVAGNVQMDSNGIRLHPFYSAPGPECPKCPSATMLQYFVDIRDNLIAGEYKWDSDCSWSGITISSGASPTERALPPAIAYGLTVSGNKVLGADGLSGGAISIVPTWWDGPKRQSVSLIRSTIINNNFIRDIRGPVRERECNRRLISRHAIVVASRTTKDTLIMSNICVDSDSPAVKDRGKNTVIIRDNSSVTSCEK